MNLVNFATVCQDTQSIFRVVRPSVRSHKMVRSIFPQVFRELQIDYCSYHSMTDPHRFTSFLNLFICLFFFLSIQNKSLTKQVTAKLNKSAMHSWVKSSAPLQAHIRFSFTCVFDQFNFVQLMLSKLNCSEQFPLDARNVGPLTIFPFSSVYLMPSVRPPYAQRS